MLVVDGKRDDTRRHETTRDDTRLEETIHVQL